MGAVGLVMLGGETVVKERGGPVGVGAGIVASELQTTVFCAPIIKLLDPETLLALPLTVLLFPSKVLVFPLTVLLDPLIALLLPLPLLLVPFMMLFTPVIVLPDTVKVPVLHVESLLPELDPLEEEEVVVGVGGGLGPLVELTDPPEVELAESW